MTIRTGFTEGEVCWTDLQTRDVAAAKEFYSAVFGWRFKDLPTPDGRSYAQAYLGGDLVTVIAPQNPQQQSAGAPGQWNVYLASADARDLAAAVVDAGGALEFGPEPVGDSGVMIFFAPPGGGSTGAWQAGSHFGTARSGEPGSLAWAELLTPEPQPAVAFFQEVFGHEVTEYPQDDGGRYSTLMVDGAEVAGVAAVPAEAQGALSPGWQVYFGAASVGDAVAAAVAAGGVVLIEPDEVDEAGAIATLADPQGGVFSVLEV
ncbi:MULTISPECIES: VOC family protein [unclassified Arthrobacter]|uniref:VOC family protein n=1 Tax=unclassified Arthrobacter TaxID=235627 RepID=UPI002E04C3B2|nr:MULTISPECIES: VOC family protein [unclassified Arthrobacter]MEC5191427.1 putative enzyme related to lactoylglutathione lyase [Arthrobacter sp. MP_M4]MEC5203010.1 putative enzyme related to lactoylglutathione lyase [Arthrobacter sp. MP_M7]